MGRILSKSGPNFISKVVRVYCYSFICVLFSMTYVVADHPNFKVTMYFSFPESVHLMYCSLRRCFADFNILLHKLFIQAPFEISYFIYSRIAVCDY